MSSTTTPPSHSIYLTVPQEARRISRLLAQQNPALKIDDKFIESNVVFEGGPDPIQPGPLKSAAVVAAHFAALGAVADQIAQLRYNDHNIITIDTDHAGYFLACVALFMASGKGPMEAASLAPNFDEDWWGKSMHHQATAIYPTKDGRSFMVHGSLNASSLLSLYGLDENDPRAVDRAAAREIIAEFVLTKTAAELEKISVDAKECGSICYEPEEWAATEMGKALAARPLIDVEAFSTTTRPNPFPALPPKPNRRPLEGIKVVAMVRVIAGPMIGRTLAELGATVIKVNPPHLRDISMFQFTLTVGTKTVGIDLRKLEDKAKLVKLVGEADVFIDGYRSGAMERLGFDEEDVVRMVKEARGEDAGIVYVHENCFGRHGSYSSRPGWQQIADVASGAAMIQSRGLGYTLPSEAVLPPLPIADLTTGILAATGVLCALRDRALDGGSYRVVASLTASNVFSISPEVGLYPQSVVDRVQEEFGFPKMTGADGVLALLMKLESRWREVRPEQLDMENSCFFMNFEEGPFGPVRMLAPVLRLSENTSKWEIPPRPFCYDEATFDF